MKTIVSALVLTAVIASPAFAAARTAGTDAEPVQHYAYGQTLDIKRVISLTDVSREVGVVPVTLVYEDSQGEVHKVVFSQIGGGASGG